MVLDGVFWNVMVLLVHFWDLMVVFDTLGYFMVGYGNSWYLMVIKIFIILAGQSQTDYCAFKVYLCFR